MNLNYGKDRKRGVDFLAPQFPGNSGLNISPANAAGRSGGTGLARNVHPTVRQTLFPLLPGCPEESAPDWPGNGSWRFISMGTAVPMTVFRRHEEEPPMERRVSQRSGLWFFQDFDG